MGHGYKHGSGGGTSLNFKIVGGTTRPTNPPENTIWVNTATKITSWIFSATEPSSAEEGMVLISVGTASNVAFSATKKNPIMVYPLYAKQCVSGAWVKVDAEIYQDGWTDLLTEVVFFADGEFNIDTFGSVESTNGSYSVINSCIRMQGSSSLSHEKAYDVTAFNTIEIVISNHQYAPMYVYLVDESGKANSLTPIFLNTAGTHTLNISDYFGPYYLHLNTVDSASNYIEISSVKFKV